MNKLWSFLFEKINTVGKLKLKTTAIYIALEFVNQQVVFYPIKNYSIMSSGLHSRKVKAEVVNLLEA